jgi:hypothetical protein
MFEIFFPPINIQEEEQVLHRTHAQKRTHDSGKDALAYKGKVRISF